MVMLLILYRSVKSRVIKTRLFFYGDFTGIAEIRAIKGTCALKIKIAAIKGGIIGSAKIFIENECPPFNFAPLKVAFSSKVKLPLALLKAVLVVLVVPLKE
ncbi:hypothetical protein HpVH149_01680 [Helicobacter pylori]